MTLYTLHHTTLHYTTLLHTPLTAAVEEKLHSTDCPRNTHSSIYGILHPLGCTPTRKTIAKKKRKKNPWADKSRDIKSKHGSMKSSIEEIEALKKDHSWQRWIFVIGLAMEPEWVIKPCCWYETRSTPNPVFEQTFSKRGLGVRICLGYYLH